jgi:hypothetical protein
MKMQKDIRANSCGSLGARSPLLREFELRHFRYILVEPTRLGLVPRWRARERPRFTADHRPIGHATGTKLLPAMRSAACHAISTSETTTSPATSDDQISSWRSAKENSAPSWRSLAARS